MGFLTDFVNSINAFLSKIFPDSSIAIFVLVAVIVVLTCVFIFVCVKFGKLCQRLEKKLVYQYDNIFYLWSKYYHDHKHIVGYNPGLIVLKTLVDSGNPEYIPNRKLIKKTVLEIEKKVGSKAIPDAEWTKLSALFARWKIRKLVLSALRIIFVLIILGLIFLCLCSFFN